MANGLFILLHKEEDLKIYLKNNTYGFITRPLDTERPSSRSNYFSFLADYGCSRPGTKVFFFLKRKIYYGGTIESLNDVSSFYLNGKSSPIGRSVNSRIFWDESSRYIHNDGMGEGRFMLDTSGNDIKAQPFMFEYVPDEQTGKYITSDDLYFELGHNSFPLPSNSIMGMSFCVLTPGETSTCLALINNSENYIDFSDADTSYLVSGERILYPLDTVDINDLVSESELEFFIVSNLRTIYNCIDLESSSYDVCRQVPISPFKPMNMDRADICLYNRNNYLMNGLVPNVVIELKKDRADWHAYNQVQRYLKWLEIISDARVFSEISAIIIARDFKIKRKKVQNDNTHNVEYENKIKMFNILTNSFYTLE